MDKKIYTVSSLTWVIPFAFALLTAFTAFFTLAIAPQIPNMESPFIMIFAIFGIIGLLFFTLYGTLACFDFAKTRLELSNDGVIFSSTGYRIYTPWENIAGIGWTRFSRSFPSIIQLKEPAVVGEISLEEGKLSRRAVTEKRSWWMGNWQLKTEAQYTHSIRIPVIFLRRKEKQDGSIDQYLQYYLPHLMQYR